MEEWFSSLWTKGRGFELAYVLQRMVCVVAHCFQLHCTAARKDFKYWLT